MINYYLNDGTITLIQINCALVLWRPVAKWPSPRSPTFHSSRLGGHFCILCHTSLALSLQGGLTLRPGRPWCCVRGLSTPPASSGLFPWLPVISSQQMLSYSQTQERANCLSSSVWIKQALQKLFALNHIVRPFNNAWKHHPFSSSLGFWPAMLQVDLFSAVIELIYKDIVNSTLADTWVKHKSE